MPNLNGHKTAPTKLCKVLAVDPAVRIVQLEAELAAVKSRQVLCDDKLRLDSAVRLIQSLVNQKVFRTEFDFRALTRQVTQVTAAVLGFSRGYIFYQQTGPHGEKMMVGQGEDHVMPRWEDVYAHLKYLGRTPDETEQVHQRYLEKQREAEDDNRDAHLVFGDWKFYFEDARIPDFEAELRTKLGEALNSDRPEIREAAGRIQQRLAQAALGDFHLDINKFSSDSERRLIQILDGHVPNWKERAMAGHSLAMRHGWHKRIQTKSGNGSPLVQMCRRVTVGPRRFFVRVAQTPMTSVLDKVMPDWRTMLPADLQTSIEDGRANRLLTQMAVSQMALEFRDFLKEVDSRLLLKKHPDLNEIVDRIKKKKMGEGAQAIKTLLVRALREKAGTGGASNTEWFPQRADWDHRPEVLALLQLPANSVSIECANSQRPVAVTNMVDPEYPVSRIAAEVFRAEEIIYMPVVDRKSKEVTMILAFDKPFRQSGEKHRKIYPELMRALRDISDSLEVLYADAQRVADGMAMLQKLNEIVMKKDTYTRGHATRVANLASWVMERLEGMVILGEKVVDAKRLARLVKTIAEFHDVGKVMVDSDVLKAPRGLVGKEIEEMRNHAAYGRDILLAFDVEGEYMEAVLHHLKFDGDGYPQKWTSYIPHYQRGSEMSGSGKKVRKEDVPREAVRLIAFLIAMADMWDAMSGGREYNKKGFPTIFKIHELVVGAGNEFHPELVAPFLQTILDRTSPLDETDEKGTPKHHVVGTPHDVFNSHTKRRIELIREGYLHLLQQHSFADVAELYCWKRVDGEWVNEPYYKAPVIREFLEAYFKPLFEKTDEAFDESVLDWEARFAQAVQHMEKLKGIESILSLLSLLHQRTQAGPDGVPAFLKRVITDGTLSDMVKAARAIEMTEFIKRPAVKVFAPIVKFLASNPDVASASHFFTRLAQEGVEVTEGWGEKAQKVKKTLATLAQELNEADILFSTLKAERLDDTFTEDTIGSFLSKFESPVCRIFADLFSER